MEFLTSIRLLADRGRVRMLRLLSQEELSVAELQEILGMGQSTISMQLSQLKAAGFVGSRRSGQKSLYRATAPSESQTILAEVLRRSTVELEEAEHDDQALQLILGQRKDKLRSYFDELAGRFGRNYVPGRSWKSLAEMLIRLLPPLEIADIGAGEATLSLLLAQRAKQVIAVDSSQKMVDYGAEIARRHGVENIEYRLGDFEALPVRSDSIDLALMHQVLHHAIHPSAALCEAWRIVRPGGRIVILDLLKHDVEQAREMYADVWLGFSRVELIELLKAAGFANVDVSTVDRDTQPPHFETILAIADKPS